MTDYYVMVQDGSGGIRWVKVPNKESAQKARESIAAAGNNWAAPGPVFEANPAGLQSILEITPNFNETVEPPLFGTLGSGAVAGTGSGAYGTTVDNPIGEPAPGSGASDVRDPSTAFRTFLNRGGSIGAGSAAGQLAQIQIQPVAEALVAQGMGIPGFAVPGGEGESAGSLASILNAGGLQGITKSALDAFNLLATSGSTDYSTNRPTSPESDATQQVRQLGFGALLGQNPHAGALINRLIQQATDMFFEQQRNTPGTPGTESMSPTLAGAIQGTVGKQRFDPTSIYF